MKKKKLWISLVLFVAVLSALGLFLSRRYTLLGGQLVSCRARQLVWRGAEAPGAQDLARLPTLEALDLRAAALSPEDFERLSAALPNCQIRWLVPLQGERLDSESAALTLDRLSPEAIERLRDFPALQTVDARDCPDADAVRELRRLRPDLDVQYCVTLGDELLPGDAASVRVDDESLPQLLTLLDDLPALQTVDATACRDYALILALQQARPSLAVDYCVMIGSERVPGDAEHLTLPIADAPEALDALACLPQLRALSFSGLAADNTPLLALKARYPAVIVDWRFSLCGVETSSTATELILNDIPMDSTQAVEDALACFYGLERVEMCCCGIASEDMDALWQRHPETRFIWAIPMGAGFVRTDVKAFIPYKYGYDMNKPFYDTQAKELKYLVDLECLDLGHMRMTDVSFLRCMPKLRILVLADVIVRDYSPLEDLHELEYLELFLSKFDDVSLLLHMDKLQDLNVVLCKLKNPELLMQMTWLKRLWASKIGAWSPEQYQALHEALPNTEVNTSVAHATDDGWRQSDLYYEMRDMLDMHYME